MGCKRRRAKSGEGWPILIAVGAANSDRGWPHDHMWPNCGGMLPERRVMVYVLAEKQQMACAVLFSGRALARFRRSTIIHIVLGILLSYTTTYIRRNTKEEIVLYIELFSL